MHIWQVGRYIYLAAALERTRNLAKVHHSDIEKKHRKMASTIS